jgi:hypothetical protein
MFKRVVVLLTCGALGGCATVNQMAFDKKASTIDTSDKSVLLMTIDISRGDGSRYVPNPLIMKFEKPNAQSKRDRQNFKLNKDDDSISDGDHAVIFARIALEPGPYKLDDIMGRANAFPVGAFFDVPLFLDIAVPPNSVIYVGRITAKLRTRQSGEFRAGPLLPLIDQSVSGMSTGTWDVTIEDKSAQDIGVFRANYLALRSIRIDSAPLPPFDRAAVQRWWDGEQAKAAAGAASVP